MSLNTIVGQNIRQWREFQQMKIETLAKELGITKGALSPR